MEDPSRDLSDSHVGVFLRRHGRDLPDDLRARLALAGRAFALEGSTLGKWIAAGELPEETPSLLQATVLLSYLGAPADYWTEGRGRLARARKASTLVAEARQLHHTYRDGDGHEIHPLRGLDFEVAPGETVAIIGRSGAGKSTLLHLLGALTRPTGGEVWLAGWRVSDLAHEELAALRTRYVGFVFQHPHMLRNFTVLDNVTIPQLFAGRDRKAASERALALLEQVGLAARAGDRPWTLSDGECQRVAMARAFANEPALLLADDPSGGHSGRQLDNETSERLHDVLFDLVERHGSALVVVTHNRSLAARADRVLRLVDGVLKPVGGGKAAAGISTRRDPVASARGQELLAPLDLGRYRALLNEMAADFHDVDEKMGQMLNSLDRVVELALPLLDPDRAIARRFGPRWASATGGLMSYWAGRARHEAESWHWARWAAFGVPHERRGIQGG